MCTPLQQGTAAPPTSGSVTWPAMALLKNSPKVVPLLLSTHSGLGQAHTELLQFTRTKRGGTTYERRAQGAKKEPLTGDTAATGRSLSKRPGLSKTTPSLSTHGAHPPQGLFMDREVSTPFLQGFPYGKVRSQNPSSLRGRPIPAPPPCCALFDLLAEDPGSTWCPDTPPYPPTHQSSPLVRG